MGQVETTLMEYIAGEGGRITGRIHNEAGRIIVGDTDINNWLLAMVGSTFNFQGLLDVRFYHAFPVTTTAVGDLGQMEASEPKP